MAKTEVNDEGSEHGQNGLDSQIEEYPAENELMQG